MSLSQSTPDLQALIDSHEPPLSAPLTLSFDYTRSVGSTLGAFFTALRSRHIVGVRGSDGRVHVPVVEYDPVTYEPLCDIVPVSSVGTVVSWTWQAHPLEGQPLDRPFAWALITLDGADTPLLHAVDTGGAPDGVKTGDRVHAHWVDEPVGMITDIACFVPGEAAESVPDKADDRDPVTMLLSPCSLAVQHTASRPESIFLRAMQGGTLLGARSGKDGKVYFPPREADPATGRELDDFVVLPDKGTVTTFAIIIFPLPGRGFRRPTWRPMCCSTAPISHSCIWSPRSTPPTSGWACAWRRSGSHATSGTSVSTTSTTSGRAANPTPSTTPTSTTCEDSPPMSVLREEEMTQ